MPLTVQQRDEILGIIKKKNLNINIIEDTYLMDSTNTSEPLCALALKCNDEKSLEEVLRKMNKINQSKEQEDRITCRSAPGVPESGMANQRSSIIDIVLIIDFERKAEVSFIKQIKARKPNGFFPGITLPNKKQSNEDLLNPQSLVTRKQFAGEIPISPKLFDHTSRLIDLEGKADLTCAISLPSHS